MPYYYGILFYCCLILHAIEKINFISRVLQVKFKVVTLSLFDVTDTDFCRTMLCISMACTAMQYTSVCLSVRPSVCLSITFMYSVETNKYIFKISPPSGSHTILVSSYQTLWQKSDRDPLTGAKITIFDQYLALASITAGLSRVVNITMVECRLCHLCLVRLP